MRDTRRFDNGPHRKNDTTVHMRQETLQRLPGSGLISACAPDAPEKQYFSNPLQQL